MIPTIKFVFFFFSNRNSRPQLEPGGRRSKEGGRCVISPYIRRPFLGKVTLVTLLADIFLTIRRLTLANPLYLNEVLWSTAPPQLQKLIIHSTTETARPLSSNRTNSQATRLPPTTVIHFVSHYLDDTFRHFPTQFTPFTLRLFSRRDDTPDESRSITPHQRRMFKD